MADGGCGWTEEAWFTARADEVFTGRPLRAGERGRAADALGRIVEIEVVAVHVDASTALAPGSVVPVLVADTELIEGYRVEVPGPDVAAVLSRDLVTVFGSSRDGLVRPVRVLSTVDGELSSNGYCDHQAEALVDVAGRLGETDVVDMLVRFAEANARGEGVEELSRAFEQWRRDIDAASEPPGWDEQDPAVRVLGPGTVPPELLGSLDVYGAHVAVDGLVDGRVIGVRTESGLSWGLVAGTSLPMTVPLYVLRDTDTTVEVIVQSIGGSDAEVVASIPLVEIVDAGGGIEITGSVGDGAVEIASLTRTEIAARLGIGLDELDRLRDTYLSP